MSLDNIYSLVDEAVAVQDVNMLETSTGGGVNTLPAGVYNCRLVEYLEIGKHISIYNGKPTGKPPALQAMITFEFYDTDGTASRIRSFPKNIFNNEKSAVKKLFDRMHAVYPTIMHIGHGLGKLFRMELEVFEKDGRSYNNMLWDTLVAPAKFDPNTGAPYEVPELDTSRVNIFLWNKPTIETWNALYIDGTNDKGKSKNFIQDKIQSAVDFEDSPLCMLLMGGGLPSLDAPVSNTVSTPAAPREGADVVQAPVAPVAPQAPVA